MPVVYTVITNDYDRLKDPIKKSAGWNYICFSDKPIQSKIWEWIPYHEDNRKVKILGHMYLEGVVLYVDGTIQIIGDLNKLLTEIPHRFSISKHNKRNCVYVEGQELQSRGMVSEKILTLQLERYFNDGFPIGWGLGENGIMLRDLSDVAVQKINEAWWKEYCNGVSRDQVGLMYCFWKQQITPDLIPSSIITKFFRKRKHL